jgi:hypothetical protein
MRAVYRTGAFLRVPINESVDLPLRLFQLAIAMSSDPFPLVNIRVDRAEHRMRW